MFASAIILALLFCVGGCASRKHSAVPNLAPVSSAVNDADREQKKAVVIVREVAAKTGDKRLTEAADSLVKSNASLQLATAEISKKANEILRVVSERDNALETIRKRDEQIAKLQAALKVSEKARVAAEVKHWTPWFLAAVSWIILTSLGARMVVRKEAQS